MIKPSSLLEYPSPPAHQLPVQSSNDSTYYLTQLHSAMKKKKTVTDECGSSLGVGIGQVRSGQALKDLSLAYD